MDRKQAVTILKRKTTIPGDGYTWEQINEAIDMAIAALSPPNEPLTIEQLRAELEQVKRALAMMWFAYVNSDKETPHSYETEALVEAEHILGPWSECMPIYLSRGQKEE